MAEMTDEAALALEKAARSHRGSTEALIWERARSAWEYWRGKVTSTGNPTTWAALPGRERVVWHDMVAHLDSTSLVAYATQPGE